MKKIADLRICASCEWIWKISINGKGCPKCGFGSYGAHWVLGDNCYKYAKTQKPWMDQKIRKYRLELLAEINK